MAESHVRDVWQELGELTIELRFCLDRLGDTVNQFSGDKLGHKDRAKEALRALGAGERQLIDVLLRRMARKNSPSWSTSDASVAKDAQKLRYAISKSNQTMAEWEAEQSRKGVKTQ